VSDKSSMYFISQSGKICCLAMTSDESSCQMTVLLMAQKRQIWSSYITTALHTN